MMKILAILILMMSTAFASEVTQAFQRKNYQLVSEIYRKNPNQDFDQKELIYISYSLRKLGFYRQDIKLNIRLMNKKYAKEHKTLLNDIKNAQTIDGDNYPDGMKVLYWNLMNDYGKIIEGYRSDSELIKKDHQHYLVFSKVLSELEFREGMVDKFNDRILAHIQSLKDKVYRRVSSYSFQYMSWQTEATLRGPTANTGLVITNRGICAGGETGIENAKYHLYVDGCFFGGSGGVSADTSSETTYKQSNVAAFGVKAGPGASMIVSTSGSRIGLRIPFIYTYQKLQDPANSAFDVKQLNPWSYAAALYSRWQFKTWYFQTEFGKYINEEQTFWGLGFGKKF